MASGHREHKVHNITLYPDKHSWCNVLPIKQVISHPGCKSVEIDNNVCVGACFSYSIPHTEPSDPGEVIVPYCDSCQPSEKKIVNINLECEGTNENDKATQQLKMVEYITNCTCTSCEKDKYLESLLRGNSGKEVKEQSNDTPDLLDALQEHDESNSAITYFHLDPERSKLLKNLMNHQLMTLLKNIQSENSQKDKEKLIEHLKLLNEQSKEKVSDSTIQALVNGFYRENIELDLHKLLEALEAIDNSKHLEKHHRKHNHEGSGTNDDDENDETHQEGSKSDMHHMKYHPHHHGHHHRRFNNDNENNYDTDSAEDYDDKNDDLNEEVENNPNKIDVGDSQISHKVHHKIHMLHHSHKHHITHEEPSSTTDSSANEVNKPIDSTSNKEETMHINPKHHHHMHHIHHNGGNHHLGEHMGNGHLAHGPHGSLVIEPDHLQTLDDTENHHQHHPHHHHNHHHHHHEIKHNEHEHKQINVNLNDLKPNHEGTIISYSSHPVSPNSS